MGGPAALAVSALLSYQTLLVTTSVRRSWRLEKIVTLTRDVASARMEASVLTTSVQLGQPLLLPLFHVLPKMPLVSVLPLELSEIAALARVHVLLLFLALDLTAMLEQL